MYQKIALKYGIIAGVGTIAYLLLFYFISPRLMLNTGVIWSTLLLFFICMYRATVAVRDQVELFPAQLAIRPPFIVYVIATVMYNIFYYLMFNLIDPDLLAVQYEIVQENAQRMADLTGKAELKEKIENMSMDEIQVTVKNVALATGRSILGGFILSLILALLLRRD